jgi:hypothetical protein
MNILHPKIGYYGSGELSEAWVWVSVFFVG